MKTVTDTSEYRNNYPIELTKGDRITVTTDGDRVKYEFINQSNSGIMHLGVLVAECDNLLVGERITIGAASFHHTLEDAECVELHLRESKDLHT